MTSLYMRLVRHVSHRLPAAPRRFCVFEHVYFARPDSAMDGHLVYDVRRELGRHLWAESGVDSDVVMPVPDSGRAFAITAGRHPVVEQALRRSVHSLSNRDTFLARQVIRDDAQLDAAQHRAEERAYTLLALQNARDPKALQTALEDWLDVARQAFEAPSGLAAAVAVIHYLLRDTEVEPEWMQRYFHKLGPGAQEAYMTGAEVLMEKGRIEGIEKGRIEGMEKGRVEGMEKGRSQGRAEGEAQIVLRQLTRKFGELPAHVTERVRNGTSEQLEQWADRLLTASQLDEVFEG